MTLEAAVRELMHVLEAETYSPDATCQGPICRAMVAVDEELKRHRAKIRKPTTVVTIKGTKA